MSQSSNFEADVDITPIYHQTLDTSLPTSPFHCLQCHPC